MTAGTGSPGIRSFGLPAAPRHLARQWAPGSPGIGSSGSTAGSGHQYDSGHWVTRHQVIWLASGHRVIWQGSGHRVTRHWIVWLDSGHRVTRHQVIWLAQRAPRHLARQWAPSHQVRQRL
ncbi:unnamed protein product [Staurois parvus]|uniref:Uncharacterized protein n=1 Tax=Staurois parvus TaxID=386267 RepID=A0ABN9BGK7_9NEOB|nr:unnamed protein product [Staurois parvus]